MQVESSSEPLYPLLDYNFPDNFLTLCAAVAFGKLEKEIFDYFHSFNVINAAYVLVAQYDTLLCGRL